MQALFQSAQHIYEKREGSGVGSGSATLTNGSGSGRPKTPVPDPQHWYRYLRRPKNHYIKVVNEVPEDVAVDGRMDVLFVSSAGEAKAGLLS